MPRCQDVFPVWRLTPGPLVSVCWQSWHLTLETSRNTGNMSACGNVWGNAGQTDILASQYNKYHQLPGAGVSVNVTSWHEDWGEEWPPNTYSLCSVYKGNHQWFIRKCTVPTINTVHIRILLKLAVLESNLKAIFGYKGGFHVAFQVAVWKIYSRINRSYIGNMTSMTDNSFKSEQHTRALSVTNCIIKSVPWFLVSWIGPLGLDKKLIYKF